MDHCTLYILIASVFILCLIVLATIVLCIQYRRLKEQKRENNRQIVSRIHEQERIANELHQTLIEKETLEKLLKTQLSSSSSSSPAKQTKEEEKGENHSTG